MLPGWWLLLILGLLEVPLGVLALANPGAALAALITVAGIWAVAIGVMRIVLAFEVKRLPEELDARDPWPRRAPTAPPRQRPRPPPYPPRLTKDLGSMSIAPAHSPTSSPHSAHGGPPSTSYEAAERRRRLAVRQELPRCSTSRSSGPDCATSSRSPAGSRPAAHAPDRRTAKAP